MRSFIAAGCAYLAFATAAAATGPSWPITPFVTYPTAQTIGADGAKATVQIRVDDDASAVDVEVYGVDGMRAGDDNLLRAHRDQLAKGASFTFDVTIHPGPGDHRWSYRRRRALLMLARAAHCENFDSVRRVRSSCASTRVVCGRIPKGCGSVSLDAMTRCFRDIRANADPHAVIARCFSNEFFDGATDHSHGCRVQGIAANRIYGTNCRLCRGGLSLPALSQRRPVQAVFHRVNDLHRRCAKPCAIWARRSSHGRACYCNARYGRVRKQYSASI